MDPKAIGNIISKNRKKLNMTQKELAKKVGVTDKAVSKWERGMGLPDISVIKPLAKTLKVGIGEIITGERAADVADLRDKEADRINEALKASLEYTQAKIKKSKRFCIAGLIVDFIIMLSGIFYVFPKINEVWLLCISVIIVLLGIVCFIMILEILIKQDRDR